MSLVDDLKEAALAYHAHPKPGKLSVVSTKPMYTQRDMALAYTPGVAEPVRAILADPEAAYRYTTKGNLVAVITNGTAVLGLGNTGPLASKPVMEGKAVLFKRFADIDVFDIEVDAEDPKTFIDVVTRIAPTFGGINLEDIKAPHCFEIEKALQAALDIPVLHDDQHGTAIIIAAALLNALELQAKSLKKVSIVCLGAGAAGIATMRLLVALGVSKKQITLVDSKGIVQTKRDDLNEYKADFAIKTDKRELEEAMTGADVFIGVAGSNLVKTGMLKAMNDKPIVFALSNPEPEVSPALAISVRPDVIMATGRSDYPNQVNNVLCFPYLFRGALNVRAKSITQAMQIAAVHAIRTLVNEPVPPEVIEAYPGISELSFGKDYILPKPMDPRLCERVTKAVSDAAIKA